MKVIVRKAKTDTWYYDRIGEIFEVQDKIHVKRFYLLMVQSYDTIRGFRISDVEVVEEIPNELFEI